MIENAKNNRFRNGRTTRGKGRPIKRKENMTINFRHEQNPTLTALETEHVEKQYQNNIEKSNGKLYDICWDNGLDNESWAEFYERQSDALTRIIFDLATAREYAIELTIRQDPSMDFLRNSDVTK